MKKFSNTLAGTDCGDAGLPAHSRDTAKAKPVLRVVPNVPVIESSLRDGAERMRLDEVR
jgi:hypothetical protein